MGRLRVSLKVGYQDEQARAGRNHCLKLVQKRGGQRNGRLWLDVLMLSEWVCGLVAALLNLPVGVLLAQVLLAWKARGEARMPMVRRPRIAGLIPAHDEAAVIVDTLAALKPQLVNGDRLLVVADNCSDDTAALARSAGAEAVERFHATLRGKGFALAFGVRYLEVTPPEVLLIVDADCRVEAGAVERLARLCAETSRPVQALYLMRAPSGASLKMRVAEFAWRGKNWVRPRVGDQPSISRSRSTPMPTRS